MPNKKNGNENFKMHHCNNSRRIKFAMNASSRGRNPVVFITERSGKQFEWKLAGFLSFFSGEA